LNEVVFAVLGTTQASQYRVARSAPSWGLNKAMPRFARHGRNNFEVWSVNSPLFLSCLDQLTRDVNRMKKDLPIWTDDIPQPLSAF
jgi:hypothetical protein